MSARRCDLATMPQILGEVHGGHAAGAEHAIYRIAVGETSPDLVTHWGVRHVPRTEGSAAGAWRKAESIRLVARGCKARHKGRRRYPYPDAAPMLSDGRHHSRRPFDIHHFLRGAMRRFIALIVFTATGCAGPRQSPHTAAVSSGLTQSTDIAEITAMRAASNAAIARRDAQGVVASMLPTFSGLWAGAVTHASRDSAYESFRSQFADTARLGYVRTPTSIDISATGLSAAEYGRWVGRRRRPDGVSEFGGSYYAVCQRAPEGWRLNDEAFVMLFCTGSASCPSRR